MSRSATTSAPTRTFRLVLGEQRLRDVTLVHGDVTDEGGVGRTLDDHRVTRVVHLARCKFRSAAPTLRSERGSTCSAPCRCSRRCGHGATAFPGIAYASSAAVLSRSDPTPAPEAGGTAPTTLYGVYKPPTKAPHASSGRTTASRRSGSGRIVVYGPGRDRDDARGRRWHASCRERRRIRDRVRRSGAVRLRTGCREGLCTRQGCGDRRRALANFLAPLRPWKTSSVRSSSWRRTRKEGSRGRPSRSRFRTRTSRGARARAGAVVQTTLTDGCARRSSTSDARSDRLLDARRLRDDGGCERLIAVSDARFSDGLRYRIEIPSVEGPAALRAVLAEAEARSVPVRRVSQGSGVMMLTDAEITEPAALGAEHGVEVSPSSPARRVGHRWAVVGNRLPSQSPHAGRPGSTGASRRYAARCGSASARSWSQTSESWRRSAA